MAWCAVHTLPGSISYRALEEMMQDRGLEVDHTTLNRWLIGYSAEIDQRSPGRDRTAPSKVLE